MAYIKYANSIAAKENTAKYIHRSPLYPWLLSLVINKTSVEKTASLFFIIQYLLIFLSGLVFFSMITNHISEKFIALISTLFFYLNFSTIFYGYVILTETLTLFLLMLTVWSINKSLYCDSYFYLLLGGVLISLTILCRFNILPITIGFLSVIILYEIFIKKSRLKRIFLKTLVFILPMAILLNGYAFLNYKRADFYGLFPTGGSGLVSRNAIIATIKGDEPVSNDNRIILDIFIKAKEKYNQNLPGSYKSSLMIPGREFLTGELYSGFGIYSKAFPDLCNLFKIDPARPEPHLSKILTPFYKEIRDINKSHLWQLRFLSLAGSFLSSTGLLTPEQPETNLGKIPSWLIISYKLFIPLFSVFVFFGSLIYLLICILKKHNPNFTIILFIIIVFSFLFINFLFATVSDANRFKFPSEPFIIVLGVYYFYLSFLYIKQKIKFY